ncbi:hypothetical protein NQK81_02300 [Amycolatopsis roodepoortensis]|uniref:DUF6624 domain-containing protein n=1 Tax=Amycolatopsis roodepoortensis TaxID=700274 RepID=UPI00214BFDEA|nr:DUF6624 domain-containing protein [Amycolatopsis roodepoortensis]UUV32305.1 hypothetical protein NQK81_02300 [Amycolatopsis roodepoortensis]
MSKRDKTADRAILRKELLHRAETDQAARQDLDPDHPTPLQWQRVHDVDARNTAFLASVIDRVGWPSAQLVGSDAAHAAWLLAQHAPAEKRARWFPLLAAAVDPDDDVAVRDHAYLADRVATDVRQPQRWGTQSLCFPGRGCRLYPLEDPAGVNTRRRSIGLEPLTEADLAAAYPSYGSIDTARGGATPPPRTPPSPAGTDDLVG